MSRRAVVWLGADLLHRLLRLPEGQHVTGVHADWLRCGVGISVEGDGLDEVPEAEASPSIDPAGYVDLELRAKFEALLQRYRPVSSDPGGRAAIGMVRAVLSGDLDPRVDMPEHLIP